MFNVSNGVIIPRPALESWRESSTVFYLTGSRRFGGARLSSDYDFFTQSTLGIRDELRLLGFVQRTAPGYEPDRQDM